MTAHIDAQNLESEALEVDPHDCHALVKRINKLEYSRAGWIAISVILFIFNLIFIIARVTL